METNILIVDDDKDIRTLLKKAFSDEGFNCFEAGTGESALEVLVSKPMNLIILDINLAGIMSGLDVLRLLRSRERFSRIPVVIMSGVHKNSEDIINSFDLGTDDFIAKPFSPRELVVRVKAVLRRASFTRGVDGILNVNNIFIDKDARSVKILGKKIELRPKEFELLWILANKKGTVLSRDFLCERVLGYDYFGSGRTIDSHIKNLRKALGEKADMIKTVRGAGYKIDADEEEII